MKTNLFKKMTSLFLAIMMLMSVMSMMASATEVPEGKFWQTISTVTMDGFTLNDGITPGGYTMWQGTQTVGDRTIYLDTTSYEYYKTKMYKPGWRIGPNTGIDSQYCNATSINKPAAVGDKYFSLDRHVGSNGWPGPDASINLANIFDEADVTVNDKVRITAYVWPEDTWKVPGSATDSVQSPAVTETTFSLWVSERVDVGPSEIDYNKNSVEVAKEGEYITTTIKNDQWNEVVLEYTITDENKLVSSIQMNNDNRAHSVEYYPMVLTLGGVKVEKLAEANGSYTIEDGKKLENISTVTMDGFTLNDGITPGKYTMWQGTQTVGNRTVYLETTSYEYYKSAMWKATYRIGGKTGLDSQCFTANSANKPTAVGEKYFTLDRHVDGGWPAPDTSINLVNIFDEADVVVGDKVRITAYVLPELTYGIDVANQQAVETPDVIDTTFSLWVSERADIGPKEIDYNKYGVENAKEGEYITTTIKNGQWNEVVLEYTITDENKSVSSIQMNSDNATHDVVYYPLDLTLGAVTVEKYVDDETETAGKITGTVSVIPTEIEDGADYDVLVGAYKVVNGVYMMLGCQIMDYEADGTYDFAIEGAEGTTEVKAYLWDMNDIEPQVIPIDCEYIAQ